MLLLLIKLFNAIAEDEESQKLKAAVFLNIALCHLKLNNSLEVKKAVSAKAFQRQCAENHFKNPISV